MAIITGRENVAEIYRQAQENGWVLPCFNSENLTTSEAVLAAASEYGKHKGIPDIPIMIGITVLYDDRPQALYYSHTRRWEVGLRLFLHELTTLAGPGGPFEHLRVLVHLDHVLHDVDKGLLSWDLSQFSSIMYDASRLPFDENIACTARFVAEFGDRLFVEGACDEIAESGDGGTNDLTSADKAERYYRQTGADMIVANLGTEHRASTSELKYAGDHARAIRDRIGPKLVLHGGSSVEEQAMAQLASDGICKVNVWTLLERESSAVLFEQMVRHAAEVAGGEVIRKLQEEGRLGPNVSSGKASLDYFSTTARQAIVYQEMKKIVFHYLSMWYR